MFLEEPVPPEDVDAMLEVQRSTSIPIAAGERLKSRLEARDYLERGAIRLYQPDAARIGGITEFRKACSMAENALHSRCRPTTRTGSCASRPTLQLVDVGVEFHHLRGRHRRRCGGLSRGVRRLAGEPGVRSGRRRRLGSGCEGSRRRTVRDHSVDLATAERETTAAP